MTAPLIILLIIVSYFSGVSAYLLFPTNLENAELSFVFIYGALAYGILALPLYLLIVTLVGKFIKSMKVIFYTVGCMLVSVVPSTAILFIWGGNIESLFVDAGPPFLAFYLIAGLVFAVGYRFLEKRIALKEHQ